MRYIIVLSVLSIFALSGCAGNAYMQGRKLSDAGDYQKAIEKFTAKIESDPLDHYAWRELGIAYYELQNYTEALRVLSQADSLHADARTKLFLGLTYEKQRNWGNALLAHRSALELNPPSALVSRIKTRQELIARRDFIDKILANEDAIDVDTIPTNTIAVYDFDGSSLGPELAPLAVGLAEFISIDLTKVKSLTVIERLRLQALMNELDLAERGVTDRANAPRVGRLLGSYRVITGFVTSPEEDYLLLGGTIINTTDGSEKTPDSEEGKLKKLFELEKAFVYQILEELGVVPTPEELKELEKLPTHSYDAFLAYCRGLSLQRQGKFVAAQTQFEQAKSADNSFSEASEQLDATLALAADAEFESVVQSQTLGGLADLGSRLGGIVENTGAITGDQPTTETTPNKPPVIPVGSVKVTGNVGGK
ncbi:MAG: tetratricopeptide repeat protein [candidate division Zixibacteria bacterium]|nr:tetratricopeptide repeat protein [candidate division Zixibacteria bacterium]